MTDLGSLLSPLPRSALVTSVYEAVRALTHRGNSAALMGKLARDAKAKSDPAAQTALALVEAIEREEGRSVANMSEKDVTPYIRELTDLLMARLDDEPGLDDAAGDAALERLRRST